MIFHRSLPKPSPSNAAPAFYRLRDVMRITALSRSTIYRRIAEGRFPSPVHLGGRASAWPSAALQQWIDNPEGFRVTTPQAEAPCRPFVRGERHRPPPAPPQVLPNRP
jgi:prophage regulatory protein